MLQYETSVPKSPRSDPRPTNRALEAASHRIGLLLYAPHMTGPSPFGFWSAKLRTPTGPLQLDRTYRVKRPFTDFDGRLHEIGETWKFVGSNYSHYDEGLSLFVQTSEGEWHIRLGLHPDAQSAVWADFAAYVEPVGE